MSNGAGNNFGDWIVFILLILLLWSLAFGVNIDGKHYGIECTQQGINVHHG
jgi:hypothetical protein